jgi:predicted ferric reductase
VGYLIVAALPASLAFIAEPTTDDPLLVNIALGAGLTGFALLTLQFVLSARFRFVEGPFGREKVMQFHRAMAIFAAALLLSHPVLLSLGKGSLALFSLGAPWQVNLGKGALALLLVTVALALRWAQRRMRYQLWRVLHKGAAFVVILGFVHGLVIGPDLQSGGVRACWWALFIMAGGIFLYRNVLLPLFSRRSP